MCCQSAEFYRRQAESSWQWLPSLVCRQSGLLCGWMESQGPGRATLCPPLFVLALSGGHPGQVMAGQAGGAAAGRGEA